MAVKVSKIITNGLFELLRALGLNKGHYIKAPGETTLLDEQEAEVFKRLLEAEAAEASAARWDPMDHQIAEAKLQSQRETATMRGDLARRGQSSISAAAGYDPPSGSFDQSSDRDDPSPGDAPVDDSEVRRRRSEADAGRAMREAQVAALHPAAAPTDKEAALMAKLAERHAENAERDRDAALREISARKTELAEGDRAYEAGRGRGRYYGPSLG